MEYRTLGHSGFKVPVLSFGTGTFGGKGDFFKHWGSSDVAEASKLVDICLDAGLNMFDSADGYSKGAAEEVLGEALKGRREKAIISTKGTFRFADGANDVGSSRWHLTNTIHASLKRLQTDYIDLYQLHAFDAVTPIEETLNTLDGFVKAGKIRYIGCSNFSGWQLMKSLAISEKYNLPRHVAHQAYYSLIGRDYEQELMPLGIDQGVSAVVWSPLGWGAPHRQDPPRFAAGPGTRGFNRASSSIDVGPRRSRTRTCSRVDGCARCRRRRDGQDRPADRPQLAAATPDRGEHHHRRTPTKSS